MSSFLRKRFRDGEEKRKAEAIFQYFHAESQEKSCFSPPSFDIMVRNKSSLSHCGIKKTYAITGFLLCFTIIIGGVLYFLSGTAPEQNEYITLPSENNSSSTRTPSPSLTIQEQEEEKNREYNIFREAVRLRTISACNDIRDTGLQTECRDSVYLALAVHEDRNDVCDKISNPERKTYCEDQGLLDLATAQRDFEKCDSIQSQTIQKKCFEVEAKEKILHARSSADCTDIRSEGDRLACQNFFAARIAIAQDTNTAEDPCEKLQVESDKKQCQTLRAIREAEESSSAEACLNLPDIDSKKDCLNRFKESMWLDESEKHVQQGDYESCDNINDENIQQICRDRAITVLAKKDYKPTLCREVKDAEIKSICIEEATQSANMHFFELAKQDKDTKWCQLVPQEEAKSSCYLLVEQIISAEEKRKE